MIDALLCYTFSMSKHKPITTEMITDLSLMGDKEFAKKWGTSRQYPIRNRKRLGISAYNLQHNTNPHKFENGKEYKYCPNGDGHWEDVELFNKSTTRYDGLCGICRRHSLEASRRYYIKNDGAKRAREWAKTESGKKSRRRTWRITKALKDNAYVMWLPEHEERAYDLFGGSCAYCGIKVPFLKIEFDHFVPIKSGGKTEPSNMLPCCKKCNHGVGGKFTKDAWEWLLTKFGVERAQYIFSDCEEKLQELGRSEWAEYV